MEILGTFGHWLAVFFFWVFVLMIILGLVMAVGSILVVRQHRRPSFAMPRPNDRTYIYVGLVIMGIAGLLAYIFLGLADYKSYVKTKYNQVVHFSSKEIRLEKKVKELSDLRTQLIQKQQEVKRLQTEYQNDIRTLTVEIKAEQRANNIQSFYQAQQHPRISYDLSLIQRKRA
ncbi:MAG: hypothetical protein NTX82_07225, partial [Candidatus Parcubacteria bacterium]|nr:hypothetical protein [Candidatus Parcubacteria bacterium]